MPLKAAEDRSNKKLAVLFVILSCVAAILTSLTHTAREFLKSGKALPIIEVANDYFKAGNMKYQENDYEGAILAYQDALRLYPEYSFAWSNLGVLLYEMGSPEAAIAALSESVRLMPAHSRGHYQLGKAYHMMHFINEAISCYRKAIQINSRFTNAHYSLGMAYRDKGEVRSAMESFQRALEIDPLHAEARLGYCHMLHVKQNTMAAESCLMDTLEISPSMAQASVLMGQLHLGRRNYKRSLEYFRQALGSSPNNPIARHLSTTLIGRESNYEWRLLFIRDYYDLHAYHYDITVKDVLRATIQQLVQRVVQIHHLEQCSKQQKCLSAETTNSYPCSRTCVSKSGTLCDGDSGRDSRGCCILEDGCGDKSSHSSGSDMRWRSCLEILEEEKDDEVVDREWQSSSNNGGDDYDNDSNDDGENDLTTLYVLDLGSGTGLTCEAFVNAPSTAHVEMIGVDISSAMNAIAMEKDCYKEILHTDMNALLTDLSESEFDVITSVDVLHHVGDLEETMRTVHAILRTEGLFVFTVEVSMDTGPDSTDNGVLFPPQHTPHGVREGGEDPTRVSQQGSPQSDSDAVPRPQAVPSAAPTQTNANVASGNNGPSFSTKKASDHIYEQDMMSVADMGNVKNYVMAPHGTYQHRPAYIEQLAQKYGYCVIAKRDVQLPRFEAEGNFAPGVMFVLRSMGMSSPESDDKYE